MENEVMTKEEEQQLRERFAALDPEQRQRFIRIMLQTFGLKDTAELEERTRQQR